ncbi:hypothetical protein AX767_08215 [Variovorax sp. PAMC 28711]|nr:hypothetical protein AX767_08215 [Variovorax sp. PAMC 28711]
MDTTPTPLTASTLKRSFATHLIAACAALAGVMTPFHAQAQSEASAALSLMPVASVVGAASVAGAAASTVIVLPAALSVGGAVLTVAAVEASVDGTVYLLERASDGARASVRLGSRAANGASVGVGTAVVVSVIGTGVVLSAAGEVLAFVPNALGRALLHNEKLT